METRDLALHLVTQSRIRESGRLVAASTMAETIKAIVDIERQIGGPYGPLKTRVDFGLNIAIARFLSGQQVRLPNLDRFIKRTRDRGAVGSRYLEPALVVESIAAYDHALAAVTPSKPAHALKPDEERVLKAIQKRIDRRLVKIDPALKAKAVGVIQRTIAGNSDKQMSLMPLYVRQALGKRGKAFGVSELAELGVANIFFWTAFIIYDDFWDEDEAADPQLLPVANLFARHYVDYFGHLFPEAIGFRSFFQKLMDRLDGANAWETAACRASVVDNKFFLPEQLPDYRDFEIKFYPAAGHILGPVAMLVKSGYGMNSKEVKSLIDYFRHYLVAMQLNDDAHDWKEDLARGHISTAVSVLLREWRRAHPDRSVLDLEQDMPELEQIFWFQVLEPMCQTILKRTEQSRQALQALVFLEDVAPLNSFIDQNEMSARSALTDLEQSRALLNIFSTVQKT